MSFFECNLEKTAPSHLYWEKKGEYEKAVERIYRRTEKLNKAYALVNMKPETFQVLASELFKREEKANGNIEYFDKMTPEQLAEYAKLAFRGEETEDRLTFPNAEVLFDTSFASVKEWELLRHIGIGGSDSSVICDVSKYNTKHGLYIDKVGIPVKINTNEDRQSYFDRGHVLEDEVIGTFCHLTGAVRIRDTRMFRSRTHPHCIADIDGIIRMPDGKIRIFEAKSAEANNQYAWENNQVPPYYETQCRHYAAVLDDPRIEGTFIGCLFVIDWTFVGKYVGSQYNKDLYVSRYILRDRNIEKDQLDRNEEFWKNYIDAEIEPPVTDPSDKDLKKLKSVTGYAVEAPILDLTTEETVTAILKMNDLKQKIKDITDFQTKPLQAEYDALKYMFCEKLGPHPDGLIQTQKGAFEVRYRPSTKKAFNEELLKACYPDIYPRIVTVSKDRRTFTIEEHKSKAKANP